MEITGPTEGKTRVIYFDGGARGNGRPDCLAGWAFIDEDANYSDAGHQIGATNNEMEYTGLIKAMEYAIKQGYTDVIFRGDSQLVVEQVNLRWKVKAANLRDMHAAALGFFTMFRGIVVEWVPREKNPADYHYNELLDRVDG